MIYLTQLLSSIFIIVFFYYVLCATPNKALAIIKFVSKFCLNLKKFGVNFKKIDTGPHCQIENFDHYRERNFLKNLKIGVGHSL